MNESDILECPHKYYHTVSRTVDWGNNRGQGKRSGGTVKGGMGNAPRGITTYTGISFEKLPDYGELKSELKFLSTSESARYLKARDFGLNHKQSRCFAIGMKYLERELARIAIDTTEPPIEATAE